MTPAARLAAAIDVLEAIVNRHRPAAEALADWGKSHRFAGSADRGAIGNLVYDALRRKASLGWRMGADTPRAVLLAVTAFHWESPAAVEAMLSGEDRYGPPGLTAAERAALAAPRDLAEAPAWVAGDYPAWLDASLARVFGEDRVAEMAAMAERAPIDLRVNTLRADRAKVLEELERFDARATAISPTAVRVPSGRGPQRNPNVEAEKAFQKGWVELQDEGSQVAALLAGAKPGEQVADLCAGGGGKTLALAATMENTGQLYAYDEDKYRLAPIWQRLERAGVRNAQVRRAGEREGLADLAGKIDRAVLDVPCTGAGAWRRRPDAKWRVREKALPDRMGEQDDALAFGLSLLRPGGELVYVTCSLLAEENEDRIGDLLASPLGDDLAVVDLSRRWRSLFGGDAPAKPMGVAGLPGLRLSTRATGTDGFYVCVLRKDG